MSPSVAAAMKNPPSADTNTLPMGLHVHPKTEGIFSVLTDGNMELEKNALLGAEDKNFGGKIWTTRDCVFEIVFFVTNFHQSVPVQQ
jgi:hypothetical protein